MTRTTYGRILGALLLVAPFAIAHVETAAAAPYWVHSCRTPEGADAGFDSWTFFASSEPTTTIAEACPEKHAWFRLDAGVNHGPGTLVRGTFRAPADTSIGGYRLYRSFSSAGRPAAYYSQRELPAGSLRDRCWGEEGCFNLGSHANPFGPAPFERAGLTGVNALEFVVGCFADANPSMTCPPVDNHSVELRVHRLDVRLEDTHAPMITTPPSGPFLTTTRTLSGVQPITLGAQDRGGGVREFRIEVDGVVRSTATPDLNGGACAAPYTRAVPCPLTAAGTVSLDTATLPDGAHQLRVLVVDAAGNLTPWGPVSIVTNNVHCRPTPADPTERLRASFSRRRPDRRVTVGYKRRARVTGRLLAADGTPIANAQLCLLVRRDGRSAARDAPGPVTDAQGRFRLRLPRGPSRTLWVVHRTAAGAAAKKLRLAVRPRIRVRASNPTVSNGQRVAFRGKVSGPVPKRGVLVALQVDRGTHWQTFTTTRARRGGRFRAGYRFSRTQTAANFRMRAHVPGQSSYPYAKGSSRPFVVRVSG